jgi:transcriptional regulator with XRE-family HTH domain
MLALADKLRFLVRRLSPGDPPSARALSAAIKALPGHTRGGSPQAVVQLLKGEDTNPTIATVQAFAAVLNAPSAFLLPGWDDLDALTSLQRSPTAADIVRHLEGLPEADLAALLTQVQGRRKELGLTPEKPPTRIEAEPGPTEEKSRDRRRRPPKERGKYAADTLEGIPPN